MPALLAAPVTHRGDRLRCQRCQGWARALWLVKGQGAVCSRCRAQLAPAGRIEE
jgi:uncharacterized paraquat-inducible protein A